MKNYYQNLLVVSSIIAYFAFMLVVVCIALVFMSPEVDVINLFYAILLTAGVSLFSTAVAVHSYYSVEFYEEIDDIFDQHTSHLNQIHA